MGRGREEDVLREGRQVRSRNRKGHRHRSDRDSRRDRSKHRKHYKQSSFRRIDAKQHTENYVKQERANSRQSIEIEQPNFEPSGILLQFYNAREGVSLKFHEPVEARKPELEWRIYVFKDGQPQNPIFLKQSCYLVGKDERVCDILCENPSVSKQHAVIQFRLIHKQNIDGSYTEQVKPYIMDLNSTNGTLLNSQKISASRYYQILNEDCVKFGLSQREYVFVKAVEADA